MRNPFELDGSVDGDSEPAQDLEVEDAQHIQVEVRPDQTDDGDRSLIQDEEKRNDDLKDRFIATIDQGTTSTRFIIFDCTGVPVAKYQTEFRQIHDHSG